MSKVQTNVKTMIVKKVSFLCLKGTIAGTARNSLLNSHLTEKVPLFWANKICSKKEKLKLLSNSHKLLIYSHLQSCPQGILLLTPLGWNIAMHGHILKCFNSKENSSLENNLVEVGKKNSSAISATNLRGIIFSE